MNAREYMKRLNVYDPVWDMADEFEYTQDQLINFAERYHEKKLKLLRKSLPNKEEINLAANECSDVNGIICADEYWVIAKNDGFKEGVEWLINRLK